jgi:Leucine-rich repeat (LRR) protein
VNYFEDRLFCLDNLETLVLDKNPVKQIHSNSFVNLTSLKSLHLNNMGDRLFVSLLDMIVNVRRLVNPDNILDKTPSEMLK